MSKKRYDPRVPRPANGFRAQNLRALPRGDARTVPIIALSANALSADRQRSLEAGMNDHLAKPVEADALYKTLGAWMTGRRDS